MENVLAQQGASVSFEKVISLKQVGSPLISPDGKTIVYSISSTDWANNNYDSELWLSRDGNAPQPLTRTAKGSSTSARFTPDSKYVSFLADRGEKNQLYLIPVMGGEALQVTKDEDGVGNYEWSPDGKRLAYTKAEAESKKEKTTKERFGSFFIEGEEFKQSHLWLLNFHYDSIALAGQVPCYPIRKDSLQTATTPTVQAYDCVKLPMAKRITSGDFTVTSFQWNPDGKTIAFNRQPNPLITSSLRSDIVSINVDTKEKKTLVANPTGDFFSRWSPDGKAFVYSSSLDDSTTYFFKNNRLFIYDVPTAKSREVAQSIDENKNVLDWNKNGLYLSAYDKTSQKVFEVDPKTGKSKPLNLSLDLVNNVSFSKNTDLVALSGRNHADLGEVYTGKLSRSLKKLTNTSEQIKGWNTPINEVITWKSTDGISIDGVLLKPRNYDTAKKYPLLIVIHGGPTGIDLPDPTPSYVYPMLQWVEKGALVLRVNYRGSAGYGEKFRSLNVRNLGVGDMWDVMSGVDYLAKKGMIDTTRMGSMGWSQGGYISAFLTTNTNRFKAISVGAGISNWVTYYVNTDITPFTRQYLQATPWSDMDIYLKTSPMTNINKASTPTLIQHGEFDKRVPIPNAYELYRGLQDRGVPSRLIVYKGFGHGINKPKERLAATWHNWQWFNYYVFGEKEPALPVE
ncbi:S9 family peptidase [Rufibacter tibetensis]|uniref:Peptidase S9 prolyl oligopeptidase n=1 Tax=Rufibacter tibetensis TaxID=512763 RepID=A0A0P0D3C7_9BACT|nr:S9 family peptidase [Rufibacter tibetensis]ALJ01621.1 peptidase S9 prolyl oligopeptidase [Rufibacter tibetensis]